MTEPKNHAADILYNARARAGLSQEEVVLLLEMPTERAHWVGVWEAGSGEPPSDLILMRYYRRRLITMDEAIEILFHGVQADSVRPLIYASTSN